MSDVISKLLTSNTYKQGRGVVATGGHNTLIASGATTQDFTELSGVENTLTNRYDEQYYYYASGSY